MRWTIAALILALTIAPVAAAEKEAGKEGDKAGAPGTNIDMPFLMAPMSGEDGKLSGYAYISSRLTATSDASASLVRDKIAFIQDAFVRDVNRIEIAMSGPPAAIDNAALQARLLADARGVVGQGKLASIAIIQVQVAPLHPSPVTPAAVAPQTPDSAPAAPAKAAAKP
jgi:hypothetical protein